jgi:hypothetical protein
MTMLSRKSAALCLLLIGAPVLSSFADDNETQTLHTNAFQESAAPACSLNVCEVLFAKTKHINTVVTAISCSYTVPVGAETLSAEFFTDNNQTDRFNVQAFLSGTLNNRWYVGINSRVNLFIKQGDIPFLFIFTNGAGALDQVRCTISGYHS